MAKDTVIKLQYYKECKHSLVYKTEDPEAVVNTIYVKKAFFGSSKPKSITITVSA